MSDIQPGITSGQPQRFGIGSPLFIYSSRNRVLELPCSSPREPRPGYSGRVGLAVHKRVRLGQSSPILTGQGRTWTATDQG